MVLYYCFKFLQIIQQYILLRQLYHILFAVYNIVDKFAILALLCYSVFRTVFWERNCIADKVLSP